jgi:hypothetical protein
MKRKILQIIQATDWFATFNNELLERPLVGWALVQDEDGEMSVVGLSTTSQGLERWGIEMTDRLENFRRYVHATEVVRLNPAALARARDMAKDPDSDD